MIWKLGIIGGSGLYEIDGLKGEWVEIQTNFGAPSDALFIAELNGQEVVFLPRHGRGHKFTPSSINYRANIEALKRVGVTDIISLSAVGSLKHRYAPEHFVIVDQFIDRTIARPKSFFDTGLVAHVSMAHPVCDRLVELAYNAALKAGVTAHKGGTYLAMEGPQFSTRAESELYRNWGCDVIGMTNMPEAKLAREAEIPYVTVAMVTDYDCWNEDHDNVDVTSVIKVLHHNSAAAKQLIKNLCEAVNGTSRPPSPHDSALDNAIITAPSARDPHMEQKLEVILRRINAITK